MSNNLKPKFEVHKEKGKRTKQVAKPKTSKDGKLLGGFEYEDVEVDAGWMVYFPNGASVHIWTKEEMERQGFMNDPAMVNMDTGDESAPMSNTSFKSVSEQKSSRSNSSRSSSI
jgi:hypothetical protein